MEVLVLHMAYTVFLCADRCLWRPASCSARHLLPVERVGTDGQDEALPLGFGIVTPS